MVGIRKAPILHHFSETVIGATIIRCFNQEDRFLTKILELVDDHSRIVFHNSTSMEWLCLRINFLFDAVFVLVLVILVTLPRSAINPSNLSKLQLSPLIPLLSIRSPNHWFIMSLQV